MANCLITKLPMSIDNDSIPVLGELKIKILKNQTVSNSFRISYVTAGTFSFDSNLSLTDGNGNAVASPAPSNALYSLQTGDNDAYVRVDLLTNDLSAINVQSVLSEINSEDLQEAPSLTMIRLNPNNPTIDLYHFSRLVNLEDLVITCDATGEITHLGSAIEITNLQLSNFAGHSIVGSVEDLLDAWVANGRTSGNVNIWTGLVPYNNEARNQNIKVAFTNDLQTYPRGWYQTN